MAKKKNTWTSSDQARQRRLFAHIERRRLNPRTLESVWQLVLACQETMKAVRIRLFQQMQEARTYPQAPYGKACWWVVPTGVFSGRGYRLDGEGLTSLHFRADRPAEVYEDIMGVKPDQTAPLWEVAAAVTCQEVQTLPLELCQRIHTTWVYSSTLYRRMGVLCRCVHRQLVDAWHAQGAQNASGASGRRYNFQPFLTTLGGEVYVVEANEIRKLADFERVDAEPLRVPYRYPAGRW